jgi:hypothetical protein
MNNDQPEHEFREDRYWMKGIPRDWPIAPKEAAKPSLCASITMSQKQWDNMAGEILDDYNAGKISKELMVSSLQDLKRQK